MTRWWVQASGVDEVLELRPPLARLVRELRASAAERVPGRLHSILAARVLQVLGLPDAPALPADLTDAERAAISVAEQLVVDAHGLGDDDVARLDEHFTPAEQLAIFIDVALLDGFGRLAHVAGVSPAPPVEVHD